MRELLDAAGVPHRTEAFVPEMPNIISRWEAGQPGRHLMLNGHMDIFPVTNEKLWEAEIVNGKIMGRGASDMKTGTLASILAFCQLYPCLLYTSRCV